MPNSLLRNRVISPLSGFAPDVDNLFQHLFGGPSHETTEHAFHPRTNVIETESSYSFSVELPGVGPDQVNVEFNDGALVISGNKEIISGNKEIAKPGDDEKVLQWQRQDGNFSRSFTFPTEIDFDNIDATFKHGILEVTVKKAEKALPRKVEVKVTE